MDRFFLRVRVRETTEKITCFFFFGGGGAIFCGTPTRNSI